MSAKYVGGPFDGGTNPDPFMDQIAMRTPLGAGTYVKEADENGTEVFHWVPDKD
ncbi:hypothetical protein ACFUJY_29520 [Streptomyces sp. NPDC057249]|uniref:hypothetical protein n=1 Tax=Streptomyces sp. NPDC057249 TaxID=3346067 RepID=UPI003644DB0A